MVGRPSRPTPGWIRAALAQPAVLRLPAGLQAGSYRIEFTPQGGQGLALGEVGLAATQAATAAEPSGDWRPLPGPVRFAGQLQLAGYASALENGQLVLDLLWTPLQPGAPAAQYFVHLLGAGGEILAQADGPLTLGATPGPGQLIRQRIRLALPAAGLPGGTRIEIGLYGPPAGPRLPLTVDGQPVASGAYPLPAASAP